MQLSAAAIVHQGEGEGDALLADILLRYQQQGWRIHGLATWQGKDPDGVRPMVLRDLHTDELFVISQSLGRESSSCTLDMGALAEAGQVLRRALGEQPELVFINRFGYGETQGRGLLAEFSQLISAGIPVLTLVSEKYLDGWHEFSAGLADVLPLERSAIEQWLASIKAEQS